MKTEKAIYSYSAVLDCAKALKAASFTVQRKAEHFPKWREVKALFELCYEKTGCILFREDWSMELEAYTKAVGKIKEHSGKELNYLLHACERYLKNQIRSIYQMMEAGEVNAEP